MNNTSSDPDLPSVFIIVLNWNGWQDTIECLESLLRIEYKEVRIVLIDNYSDNDSLAHIRLWADGKQTIESSFFEVNADHKPLELVEYSRSKAEAGGSKEQEQELTISQGSRKIVLIELEENLGFARGCNVGLRYALAAGADQVLLLNNDTVVDQNSIGRMVSHLIRYPDIKAVTGQIRYYYEPQKVWNCGGNLTWYGSRRYNYADAEAEKVPQEGWDRITFITGCAALFTTDFFTQYGLLSERFFFGEEDFELSHRMKKLKQGIACVYDAIIYHKVGSSIDNRSDNSPVSKVHLYYLNRFINMRIIWPKPVWYIWRLLYSVYIIPMVRYRHKIPLSSMFKILRSIFRDSNSMEEVDREKFQQLLRR